MANPQQPELRRSGHTPVDQDHAEEVAADSRSAPGRPRGRRGTGPVPPENQPGYHPPVDQDKPTGPPPEPATGATGDYRPAEASEAPARTGGRRFRFAFDLRLLPAATAFGVTPATAHVDVDDRQLHIRFGPWSLRTPLDNVESATLTGPYSWWKVAGPAHISLADRGVTFATSTERGVCICFHEPVPAAIPRGLLKHPAATVTVADPEDLVADLAARTSLEK
jgi:hypothetical protein